MFAREDGLPFDPSALNGQVAHVVELGVSRQLEAGLDIINDGEMPKPSYATYVKDRFRGFGAAATAKKRHGRGRLRVQHSRGYERCRP